MNKGDLIRIATEKDIGDLSKLETENKSNLVEAINEVKSQGGSGLPVNITKNIKATGEDRKVLLNWTDPEDILVDGETVAKWEATGIVRKQGSKPKDLKDGVIVGQSSIRNQYKSTPFIDNQGLENEKDYYYGVFPVTDKGVVTVSEQSIVKATPIDKDDLSGSPGGSTLLKGTMEEGYFGSVSSGDLISGDELAKRAGVIQGTSQHSNTPWHKFAWKGKTLFIAQKTIRHSISWDHLNSKNVVYGNKTIEIDGVKYKVRLIRGALTDPSKYSNSDRGAKGSEWNRLICPLSIQRKDNSWDYPKYVESDLQDWGTYLSDGDLVVRNGNGYYTWCQEVGGDGSSYHVCRGGGVSYSFTHGSSSTHSDLGWRPVLEVF